MVQSQPTLIQPKVGPSTPNGAINGEDGAISKVSKPPGTITNKRRRVTRACDECRKKKVKCDGKQPCIHCTVYSYNCTYQQPNIRNKKLTGPPRQQLFNVHTSGPGNAIIDPDGPSNSQSLAMVSELVKLFLPTVNFQENPTDFNFKKFKGAFQYLVAKNGGTINLNELAEIYTDGPKSGETFEQLQERPPSATSIDNFTNEVLIILPPKEQALELIYTTWNKACVLFRFYHRPSLLEEVDLLYSLDSSQYTDRQQKFLPFMYSILATGSLFSRSLGNVANPSLEDDGFRYFMAARKLIDITNVGDIISIQTIVMMVLYLQCSARLSTCHSYIGIALRSALKEGLHRNLSIFQNTKKNKLTPIEIDTRKRLFFTIYKMDIYINSLLGLPQSLQEDEFDQELPYVLDDENITETKFDFEAQGGRMSSSGCANHHTKLMIIISHVVRELYPIKINKRNKHESITADYTHSKVSEIEMELKSWLEALPAELVPIDPNISDIASKIPERFVLANCYLHLSFLNCQIMLYRPFIHFVSSGTNLRQSDPRSLIRGRNCIKVARMVVKLANKMIDNNLLVGTYWFSMYTIFFSIACLVYYYHSSSYMNSGNAGANYVGVLFDDDLNIDKIKEDIEVGKKVLDNLKYSSNASMRIFNILNNLFEQLNRRTAISKRVDTLPTESVPLKNAVNSKENLIDETLESTYSNFDSMNNFSLSQKPDMNNGIQEPSQNLTQSQTDNYKTIPSSATFVAQKENSTQVPLGQFTDFTTENSQVPLANDYMPGLVDKLDAQIFGRILPPYMLEKNMQVSKLSNDINNHSKTKSNDQHHNTSDTNSNTNNTNNTTTTNNNNNNNNNNVFNARDQNNSELDLNEFKFDDLDILISGANNLDELDPFRMDFQENDFKEE